MTRQQRSIEDKLRAEYFDLLPLMRRTLVAIETEVRHRLLELTLGIDKFEQVSVVTRLKECDSAIDSLRRRQEARLFDPNLIEGYSLTSLHDLVGIRVLAFPRERMVHVASALAPLLSNWTSDPVVDVDAQGEPLALKYFGRCTTVSAPFDTEVQIVSALIGAFWGVEHSAMYKPNPSLRGVMSSLTMKARRAEVIAALRAFEEEFERLVKESPTAI